MKLKERSKFKAVFVALTMRMTMVSALARRACAKHGLELLAPLAPYIILAPAIYMTNLALICTSLQSSSRCRKRHFSDAGWDCWKIAFTQTAKRQFGEGAKSSGTQRYPAMNPKSF